MAVVVTYVGEEHTVDKLLENVQTIAQYVGWGSGAGTAAKSDTDLFTPETEARVLCTMSKQGTGSAAKFQAVGTIVAAAAKTITNAGLWTSAGTGSPPSGGSLIVKADFSSVALNSADQIEFTWTIDPS